VIVSFTLVPLESTTEETILEKELAEADLKVRPGKPKFTSVAESVKVPGAVFWYSVEASTDAPLLN